ncbi:MAG: SET domain-containing protein [Kofleriaceae bacterium]
MWHPLPVRAIAPLSARARAEALERLLAWTRERGARWDGIEFRVEPDASAHIVATRALAAGDEILSLPRSMMIVDNELSDTSTGTVELGWKSHPQDGLAAWLPLEAQRPDSPWRAYLDTLPTQLAALPMFRDADDLAALAGTAAHALTTDEVGEVRHTYERLPPELRTRLSLADFAWGRAVVMSRAFNAPGTFEHRLALIPLLDLLDHGRDDTAWSYNPIDGMVVRAQQAIAAGDAVHFSYGNRTNTHLLVTYGFALPANETNEACLIFDVPEGPLRVYVTANADHRFARALSIARLLASDRETRDRILGSLTEPTNIPFLGSATEEAALDLVASVARRARSELDTPPRAASSEWEQTCALIRDGERATLDHVIDFAGAARDHARCRQEQLRAAADAIADDALGGRRMLRAYMRGLADELDG